MVMYIDIVANITGLHVLRTLSQETEWHYVIREIDDPQMHDMGKSYVY